MPNFMPVTNFSVTVTVVSVATVVVAGDDSLSVGFAVNDVSANCSVVTVDCDVLDVCFVVDAVLVGEVSARSPSVVVSVDDDASRASCLVSV